MTVGEKIRTIRIFRGMTQKELGLAVGFPEKGADNRIAQYETDYRVPRKEMLDKIAFALKVNRLNFYSACPGDSAPEDLIRPLFWLEESDIGGIRLFHRMSCHKTTMRVYLQGKIPLLDTIHPMIGRFARRLLCISTLWSMTLCGNGWCGSRSIYPSKSPEKNTLNGNSTGRTPVMI